MTTEYETLLEDSIEIDAPVDAVWALVGDVSRIPDWSPDVLSTRLREPMGLGAHFTNKNRLGELEWITHGVVTRFSPAEEMAFRIEENWVTWSFALSPSGSVGTRLTQRRETPEGISEFSLDLTERYMGGQQAFTGVLRKGMRATLERIKGEAEQRPLPSTSLGVPSRR